MIDFRIKEMFFDRKAVVSAVDRAARKVLEKFGSFVMTTARQSIKKAPYMFRKKRGQDRTDFSTKISLPGHPPYSRIGLLKEGILFGYDPSKQSVVIGPAPLSGGTAEAPPLLEYGGSALRKDRKGKTRTAT